MKTLLVALFSIIAITCNAQVEATCPDCGHKILVNITANGVSVESASENQIHGFAGQSGKIQKKSDGNFGRCQAKTKKGTQCTRKAEDASGYCWQHKKSASTSTSSGVKSSFSSAGASSAAGKCKARTKSGKQCSRTARSNGYCWQHGG